MLKKGQRHFLYNVGDHPLYGVITKIEHYLNNENFEDFTEAIQKELKDFMFYGYSELDMDNVAFTDKPNNVKKRMEITLHLGAKVFEKKGFGFITLYPYQKEYVYLHLIRSHEKGIGSVMMKAIQKISEELDIPVYLDVATPTDQAFDLMEEWKSRETRHVFYEQFDFEIYNTINEIARMHNKNKLNSIYEG